MRNPELTAEFVINGIWWLPGRETTKLPGTLAVKGGSDISVELYGSFDEMPAVRADSLRKYAIVLGLSDEDELCTLFDTTLTNFGSRPSDDFPPRIKVFANRFYLGKHFPTPSDILFRSMRVRFTNLVRWLGQSPFLGSKMHTGASLEMAASYTERQVFEVNDPARSAKISIWSIVSSMTKGLERMSADHEVEVHITPSMPSTFEQFYEFIFDTRNLFALIIGSPVYAKMMVGLGDDVERVPGFKTPEDIGIYFNFSPWTRTDVHPIDMPVPLMNIEGRAEQVFSAWYSNAKKLRLVCELFFGAQYNSEMYVESKFLNYTQALEIFHRVMAKQECYVPRGEYRNYSQTVERAIPETAPDRLKEKLRTAINFANDFSLRERLEDLIGELHPTTQKMISEDLKSFTKAVVATRNYLTHGGSQSKANAFSGPSEFAGANQKLRAILSISLLKMLGIPEQQVVAAVLRNR
ncbi:MAG: ApeA N-terminal domain 1-containing protein [Terriglobia bacterium]